MKDMEQATRLEMIKKMLHPILVRLFGMKLKSEHLVFGQFPSQKNYLIVANHVCIDDIPTLAQAIKKHFYLLVSDEDKKTIDGLALNLNGVEWVKRTDKNDRLRVNKHLEQILNKKKNLAMYPEGTWNLSSNAFIMPMNYGCIRLSLKTNTPIIPVVTLFDQTRYTIIGEAFYPTTDLEESINKLRDIMSTMVYEAINKDYERRFGLSPKIHVMTDENNHRYYYEKRDELWSDYQDEYINEIYNQYKRAREDKRGVREFESQFIFTPHGDAHEFFQEFNSIITYNDNHTIKEVKRISSERDGYNGPSFGEDTPKDSFGYGYNEHVLKKYLKK